MADFSHEQLYAVMRDVFMLREFAFEPPMTARDVPGWDSLNHSILLMELERITGAELPADETARLGSIGELYDFISLRLAEAGPNSCHTS